MFWHQKEKKTYYSNKMFICLKNVFLFVWTRIWRVILLCICKVNVYTPTGSNSTCYIFHPFLVCDNIPISERLRFVAVANIVLFNDQLFFIKFFFVLITLPSGHLVPKWRRINVDATWLHCIDVDTTSFWHQMTPWVMSLKSHFSSGLMSKHNSRRLVGF